MKSHLFYKYLLNNMPLHEKLNLLKKICSLQAQNLIFKGQKNTSAVNATSNALSVAI